MAPKKTTKKKTTKKKTTKKKTTKKTSGKRSTKGKESDVDGGRLLKAVQAVAITPEDAKELVRKYQVQVDRAHPKKNEFKRQEIVADKIVKRYSDLAAMTGGATALAGVVPGLGTAVAMLGGAAADAVVTMKLQVDMAMCIAETFGYDLNTDDAKHLSFLIAAGGSLEKAGVSAGTKMASQAGVNLLRKYLQGAVLVAIREFFKKLGIYFTRKALEKALPFGVGVVIGATANYALTKYVGSQAKRWFVIDRDG